MKSTSLGLSAEDWSIYLKTLGKNEFYFKDVHISSYVLPAVFQLCAAVRGGFFRNEVNIIFTSKLTHSSLQFSFTSVGERLFLPKDVCSTIMGLPAGNYNDLSLKVCLPTKNELLPFLDQNASRAEQLWDLFVSSRARSGEIPLVIAARIFNRPINQLSPKEMNDLLHDSKDGMIGCHWIYATVSQQN
ncbi:hypothetical protein ANCDUO_05002 [Ancylostoma duodenale]|uniref:Uncharacterized protein n=1 Tax=Ancylostoma duodenale TaxID=51022 RepID=A0A0C2GTQ0_9BILA|nr:hypothetical protein ANCDUO_05002 [Ancylostoma duodenale]